MNSFLTLGPLAIVTPDGPIVPSAPMLRRTLVLLLFNADTVVAFGTLLEELWDDRPPRSAKTTLQTYVYQLRKLLDVSSSGHPAGGSSQTALLTRQSGYELRLGADDEIDARRFENLLSRAKVMRSEGLLDDAGAMLRDALALWRGTVLDDAEVGPVLGATVVRLKEAHKEALELRLDLDLQLGRHRELISELSSLVRKHPGHEGFVGKLMIALVRAGRRSDALDVYRKTRAELVNGLGLEPSIETQQLHEAILTGSVALDPGGPAITAVPRPPSPAQVPAAVDHFVGRENEYLRVRKALEADTRPDRAGARAVTRVVEIVGPPGVGKTAFAIHTAHQLRSLFPDGQLYATLGDTDDHGLAEIVSGFLAGAAVSRQHLPTTLTALISMFRTWTADRKVLVVLDDVVSASHARMLAPSGSSCALLLTSRISLTTLPKTSTIVLPALAEEHALELLARRSGRQQPAAEPDARLLARLCECLPTVLNVVASRLAAHSALTTTRLFERLSAAEDMLAELGEGGTDFLAGVELSYRQLPTIAQHAFEYLGNSAIRIATAEVISTRFRIPLTTAESALEKLADAYLLETCESHRHRDRVPASGYRISPLFSLAARKIAKNGHAGPRLVRHHGAAAVPR
jgi:DNA-binding SARP family transcriptional activator